ncbi:hypothetical protein PVAR5_6395 [Paecilomyces variotii No. 5]|uniref:Uncharacterized protein n=1 Tax=Byssochlamys spectabilis (strain No. 5 / NBRC 109023) TaxID=1356009 RepID=V5I3J1_BYSSN|nr:hypothetical protein PVAR5_6395 [Paecilomyces variotii No. 5]
MHRSIDVRLEYPLGGSTRIMYGVRSNTARGTERAEGDAVAAPDTADSRASTMGYFPSASFRQHREAFELLGRQTVVHKTDAVLQYLLLPPEAWGLGCVSGQALVLHIALCYVTEPQASGTDLQLVTYGRLLAANFDCSQLHSRSSERRCPLHPFGASGPQNQPFTPNRFVHFRSRAWSRLLRRLLAMTLATWEKPNSPIG